MTDPSLDAFQYTMHVNLSPVVSVTGLTMAVGRLTEINEAATHVEGLSVHLEGSVGFLGALHQPFDQVARPGVKCRIQTSASITQLPGFNPGAGEGVCSRDYAQERTNALLCTAR